jgi:hypothetical protein
MERRPDINKHVKNALKAAQMLHAMADVADEQHADNGCAAVSGVLRDCACKIRGIAEREKGFHKRRGIWHERQAEEVGL